ncbi:MAG TPA: PxKF domain-containing protein [Pyrinomonadaceae bacterium]
MKTPARRRSTIVRFYPVLVGLLVLFAAVLMAPSHLADSSWLRSGKESAATNNLKTSKGDLAKRFDLARWISPLSLPAMAGETIELFAADCATPKTDFAAGETICAKTDGVDLTTVPNNYYVNWLRPDNTATNGGTITTNPQYTLFSIPAGANDIGTWKANIGRVTPAESSIIGSPPLFTVSATQAIATFAWDVTQQTCTNTPKTHFVVGETVCARTVGVDPQFNRRFAWVDADGITREFTPITSEPATDDFAVLLTETSTGTWKANVVSSKGSTVVGTPFTVAGLTPSVDLSIAKGLNTGELKSGEDATFTIAVYNRGPNDAENVVVTDQTPVNLTFVAPATQTQGSGFTCTGTTTVTCTSAVMKAGERAVFEFVYTPGAAGQTVTNTATVDSDTAEAVSGRDTDGDTIDDASEDNSATAGPYVIGQGAGGGGDCELTCPSNITATANTTENGQRGAHVNYAPAQSTGTCETITYSHASGSFFPVGDTTVTATAGDASCTFNIRVEEAGNTAISCPANQTADADSSCEATVSVGLPTASGDNLTFFATRSDGKPMYTCDANGNCTRNSSDEPFAAGTTTITWFAYSHDEPGPYTTPGNANPDGETFEEQHRTGSASCTQTITVRDVTPPVIAATDSTVSADENCSAVIPDYSSTVTDNCACSSSDTSERCEDHPQITYTQTPAAGTVVGPGSHTVHIEASDGSEHNNGATKDVIFTVEDTTAPVIDCPDNIVATTDSGACSAVVDPGTATATDNCDTSVTITGTRSDSQALNAPYPKGTTTITWRATDDAGNYSECQQTVTVNDEEPPTITCQANITVYVAPNSTDTSAVVNYTTPVGQDNCAGSTTTQEAGLPSGSSFPLGTTTNTFRVTDASGNYAECSFTVTVLYNFTGFFSPVSNPPAFNNVNAGRTIPLKFSLSGNKGLSIFAAGYPMSQQIACDSSAPLSELEGTETTGGSTLTYSPDTYQYNWKSESSWAGTCRILIVKLNDGTEHTALFKFK